MNFRFEKNKIGDGYTHIVGCDEVGRGCLAGPVVAAAVVFHAPIFRLKSLNLNLKDVKDSKLLTAGKREELSEVIKKNALWSFGVVSEEVVDEINIHNATLLAMRQAVEGLLHSLSGVILSLSASEGEESQTKNRSFVGCTPQDDAMRRMFVVIDGKFTIPNLKLEQEAVVGGDNKILSIAAASIIAKVYRDDLMRKLHLKYPIYNFARHKGYGTLFHRTMIMENGLSPIHRRSFCRAFFPSLDPFGKAQGHPEPVEG